MRVISGTRRGHRLKQPKTRGTRPTEDRIKESIFNVLGYIDTSSIVLDLFAGSGSVGIEFLSRGAKKAYFIDKSSLSIETIKENLDHTKFSQLAEIKNIDSRKALGYFKDKNIVFDYIFLDPPFKEHDLLLNIIESISENVLLSSGGIIIVEHERELKLKDVGDYKVVVEKDYGNKGVSFFKNQTM